MEQIKLSQKEVDHSKILDEIEEQWEEHIIDKPKGKKTHFVKKSSGFEIEVPEDIENSNILSSTKELN